MNPSPLTMNRYTLRNDRGRMRMKIDRFIMERFSLPHRQMLWRRNRKNISLARFVMGHLMSKYLLMSPRAIAEFLRTDRTCVNYGRHKLSQLDIEAEIDRQFEAFEGGEKSVKKLGITSNKLGKTHA